MNRRSRLSLLTAVTFALVSPLALAVTPAAPNQANQSWSSPDGWVTELRHHPGGTASCATAKNFRVPHAFGIFMARSGAVTVFALVDQQQPFTHAGTLKLVQNGREIGRFGAQAQGPSFATAKGHSDQVKALIGKFDAGVVTIDAAGRQYRADFAGIGPARSQLDACVTQMAKPAANAAPAARP